MTVKGISRKDFTVLGFTLRKVEEHTRWLSEVGHSEILAARNRLNL